MNRRQFLGVSAAVTAAMVLDPERLLWVPGAKTFFLPSREIVTAETMAEALTGGRDGMTLGQRLAHEVEAVRRMGGYIIENTQYVQHTIPRGVLTEKRKGGARD